MQKTQKTIALISLGCAKNLINSEQMAGLLTGAGFAVTFYPDAESIDNADIALVNTCGFIGPAKEEAIDMLLELGAMKDAGRIGHIVAAGCLPERYKDEIAGELPEVDAFIGVGGFGEVVSVLREVFSGVRTLAFPPPEHNDDNLPRKVSTPRAWTYLKLADGCDNRCAFCAIPDIRGRYRSRPEEKILSEAEYLARGGVRELILVAQDVTRYGLDLYGELRLVPLLRRLSAIDGIKWIRLHYLYPDILTDGLIDEIARNDKVLKYLDIPIQHINDGILQSMRRRGTGGDIRGLIKKLRERIPEAVLRTSLIAGLPGEGEEEFEELCQFLREARFERAGVFPYSPEEGTPAAELPHPDESVAAWRAEQIEQLQSRIMDEFNESRIGQTEEILVEGIENGRVLGRSRAESPGIDGIVFVDTGTANVIAAGEFITVQITGSDGGDAVGKLIGGDS